MGKVLALRNALLEDWFIQFKAWQCLVSRSS